MNNTQTATVYVGPTQLQATVPAGQLVSGAQLQVAVTDGKGATTSTAVTLTVDNPAPVLISLAPSMVAAGVSSASITLTGSGFVPTSLVTINGNARPTTFTSATQLNVSLNASDLAVVTNLPITVTNSAPGGGSSSAQQCSVVKPLPVINSILPASVAIGSSSTSLDIVGTNFLPTTVALLNNSALSVTFISSTELRATIPASSLTAGTTVLVVLTNPAPGGGASTPFELPVVNPQPVLTSIFPVDVAAGAAATTITLTGSGFLPDSVVQWNGSSRPTTFVSGTSLQVHLPATDLMNSGTGKLTVSNPAPGGGSTLASTLNITSLPIPTIQGITLATQAGLGCSTIQATITGTNFVGGNSVQLNGFSLRPTGVFSTSPGNYKLFVSLPVQAIPTATPLTFTVTNNFSPPVISNPYTLPSTTPALVALCSSPVPADVYPNTSFSIFLTATEVNSTAVPTVTLGALPTGVTLTSPASISIPASGAALSFTASSGVAPGTYSIPVTGQAGSLSFTGSIQLNIQAGSPPSFFFSQPLFKELGVPIGGSNQIQFNTFANGSADYNIVPTVAGLPPGTTATVSPSTIIPGQPVNVVVTASPTAPVSQNVIITITGTPAAAVPPAQGTFLLDVTAPAGSLPGNRTDFISTSGTPYAAVYDLGHNLIFASNPNWNRVDVISNQSHKIVGSINIRDPRGLDITPDNSVLWVATGSQQIYSIDTSTLAATHFTLPNMNATSGLLGQTWEGGSVLTLSDGTLLLQTNPYSSGTSVIWTPGTNSLTPLNGFSGPLRRSGNHSRVYGTNAFSSPCQALVYSAASKTIASYTPSTNFCIVDASNMDGSRLVGISGTTFGIYDGNFNLIGNLPGAAASAGFNFNGGFVFSPDGSTLFQIGAASISQSSPVILTYDVASLTLEGTAPAMATLPVGVSETPNLSMPFAVDSTGMILGIQDFGIGFDDSTFFQKYADSQPSYGPPVGFTPNAGPIAGGTASSPYGGFSLTPDVWYGQNRGTVSLNANDLTITSPAGDAAGPVNLKYIFPDGAQIFAPQAFSYSTYPQYATLAGASPNGNVAGQIAGYGMPANASGGTLTVAGQTATITTTTTQYPPYTREPFPSTFLNFTIPAGSPGWADLQIQTPIGTGTLPNSIFYAKSVTDYDASPDTFTAVLYDRKRNQVYLSAKDHIDVFSVSSSQFITPLIPAVRGTSSQFAGLALTPDGSQLLATNTLDGSLAVINPDDPSTTYAIPVAGFTGVNRCTVGPLYVAATSNGQAFVTTGSIPGTSGCPSEGNLYVANLATRTASSAANTGSCYSVTTYPFTTSFGADAPSDGSFVAMGAGTYGGACIYSVASNTYSLVAGAGVANLGITVSPDGNILGSGIVLDNPAGTLVGRLSHPVVFYGQDLNLYAENQVPTGALFNPRLNDSGSLYFWPFTNYFEIVDVPTGRLRLRFSLNEKIQSVVSPLALDSGHKVFLITDKGLTVVDLGSAPLSIGHLSLSSASSGTQIQVRGSGFASGVIGTIGGQPGAINFIDENTLTITVPSLSSGPKDLTVTNPDGSTYVLQNAITIR